MKLIAESGGTKTNWCAFSGTLKSEIVSTIGLNPNFITADEFTEIIKSEVIPALNIRAVEAVWFYGAGCSGEIMEEKVRSSILKAFPSAAIHVYSDLTGAARGLLGEKEGYICMLGTGSNSGYYDGKKITVNIPPLGFILGDEGSGASLGKRLLADFLRGIMPSPLSDEFRVIYGPEKDEIVSHVYRGVFPSSFIGGFVRFIKSNIENPYCHQLVRTAFEDFVRRNLRLYKTTGKTGIAVTGSVAWHFREILEQVLNENNFEISCIQQDPMQGLIKYHKKRNS